MPWQAIGAIGSSLLGGLFGKSGAKKQNEANIQSAREQMDFQERMSNTAHVREVADLKNAGLNPILSAKLGGASSPGGAMPNIVNEMAPMENAARSMGDKLYNFRIQDASVDNMKLQNDLLKEQVDQLRISNARTGLMTPAWERGGQLVDRIADYVDKKGWLNPSNDPQPDVIQGVMDAVSNPTSILNEPATAKAVVRELAKNVPLGTEKSEARKFARGEKTWLQSFKDANTQPAKLTEEKIREYGVRRLEELRKKHGFMKQR